MPPRLPSPPSPAAPGGCGGAGAERNAGAEPPFFSAESRALAALPRGTAAAAAPGTPRRGGRGPGAAGRALRRGLPAMIATRAGNYSSPFNYLSSPAPPPPAIRRQERGERLLRLSSPAAPLGAAFGAIPVRSTPAGAAPGWRGAGGGADRARTGRRWGGLREDAALPRFPPPCPCPVPAELGRSPERRRRPRLAPTAARSPGEGSGPGSDPGPAAPAALPAPRNRRIF